MSDQISGEVDVTPDPARTLPFVTNLQRAVHVVGVYLEQSLRELRLTQGEMHVLSILGYQGTLSVTDLQRNVRHRPSTLTGILDRLEARGMVQRRVNREDRRSNLIELTAQGHDAAERVLQAMADLEGKVFASSPQEQERAFTQTLNTIAETL